MDYGRIPVTSLFLFKHHLCEILSVKFDLVNSISNTSVIGCKTYMSINISD